MPLETPPSAIAEPSLPLPSLADRASYGVRRREWLRWENEELTPGLLAFALNVYANALHAAQMATQAASTAGFLGEWGDQTGGATKPASVLHENVFYVLLQDVADITDHTPGVSIVWGSFEDSANAENTDFDDTTAALGVSQVQAAIEALVVRLAARVSRTSATGSAVMPVGTTAQRDLSPSLGYKRWNTSLNDGRGAWETWNGTTWEQEGWVYAGTVATTSGTDIDFNSIPAWVNEVELRPHGIRNAEAATILFRLGTVVGFDSTDYVSTDETSSAVSGFRLSGSNGSNTFTGRVRFVRGPDNTWEFDLVGLHSGNGVRNASGYKTASGVVTRIRMTTTAAVAFNLGSVPWYYRK